jgi:hypothetical protein
VTDVGACTEREITEPVALCAPGGRLAPAAVGWARQPIIDASLPGAWGRRKRWDFWNLLGPTFACNITCADVDYLGLVDVWFRDLRTGRELSRSAIKLVSGRVELAARAGESAIDHQGALAVSIIDDDDGTRLQVTTVVKHVDFQLDVVVRRPDGHESLTVVIPWSARRYQLTTKDLARPAVGTITWGDTRYALADDGQSWGTLDLGRGRWPYRTIWNWGAGMGVVDGRRVGVQLGGKWTDGTGMTEGSLVVDGRLSKLSEELVWEYDPGDFLRPWHVRTPRSDRVDLAFTPDFDKRGRLQAGIAASRTDQCFGQWSGRIVPDDRVPIEVDGLQGWAEECTWRW